MQLEITFAKTGSEILEGLNEEQLKAVTHKTGPLLIIAGAGTGKTTVITRRIAYIIEKHLADPSEILALTFTEKAAAEMEERVDQLIPYGYADMWISTFHAFGDRLLRDYALDLGLPANFKVLTGTEQAIFIKENLFAFDLNYYRPLSNPLGHIEALLKHFSRLKDELITPTDYIDFVQNQNLQLKDPNYQLPTTNPQEVDKLLEVAKAYERYNELMLQAGNLDFGDQIFLTYQLLKNNPKILKELQSKFKYILVDEYQDTNFAQNEIVKLLAGPKGNITVVGDDDQAIYRFRGASISNILQFKASFKNIKQVVLNKNYRSTQEILNSSYALIQHNNPDRLEYQNKIDKKLAGFKHGPQPELLFCDTLSCEADRVVAKIGELKKAKNYQNRDFAILVRANSHAEPFVQALNFAGIPHIFSGTTNLFFQPEIKMLIALLKCLAYSDDNISCHQLATSELYNINPNEMTELYTQARRRNRSIIDIVNQGDESQSLLPQNTNLNALAQDIVNYRNKLKSLNTGELLYQFLTEKAYLKKLTETPSVENELKIQNIAHFFDRIAQFNHASNDQSILAFLSNLELFLEFGNDITASQIDPDLDAVNILTVHAAKGLEWPVVFVANVVADRFPARKKRDPIEIPEELIKEKLPSGDFHLQEERRLFYVAATRAKEQLYLTAAEDYGGKRSKKLSPFALELLNEPNSAKLKHELSPLEKIERFKKLAELPKIKVKRTLNGNLRLSRLQIDDYYTCPKKYYFAHVIKIPLLENANLMYGTAIHAALDHYFKRRARGEETSLNQMLLDFRQSFHSVGFITIEHEKMRYQAGINALTNFYQADQASKTKPSQVETSFAFFSNDVVVNGRYDLVYRQGEETEIRDFKTSQVKDQKDADSRIKKSTQMRIYALSWREQHKMIPKTTLYFIESGLKGERIFSEDELEETREMILSVASGIKSGDMTAKPERFACQWCAFRDLCPEAV